MTTTIRRAEPGEGDVLHELASATFGLACPPGTTEEEIVAHVAANLSAERLETYLADPDREILVAVEAGRFVGYTMVIFGAPTDPDVAAVVTTRPTAELSKCYLLPDGHGTGLASDLMRATIDTARLRGALTLWLGVNDQNVRANRFYEKHGFQKVGNKSFVLGDRVESDFTRELVLGD